MTTRKVIKTIAAKPHIEGKNVHLMRVVSFDEIKEFDPFLLLDIIDTHAPKDYVRGFPWHPHRGTEMITYILNGKYEDTDSNGNSVILTDNECSWVTSGSGIIHKETIHKSEYMSGFQLWVNLPQKDKMVDPKYTSMSLKESALIEDDNSIIRVISGEYEGLKGLKGDYVDVQLLEVYVKPNKAFSMPTNEQANLFIYVTEGAGLFGSEDQTIVPHRMAALFDKGSEFYVKTGDSGARFFVFSAEPLNEPVVFAGAVVVNSRKDLLKAFQDLDNDNFVKGNNRVDGVINYLFYK